MALARVFSFHFAIALNIVNLAIWEVAWPPLVISPVIIDNGMLNTSEFVLADCYYLTADGLPSISACAASDFVFELPCSYYWIKSNHF